MVRMWGDERHMPIAAAERRWPGPAVLHRSVVRRSGAIPLSTSLLAAGVDVNLIAYGRRHADHDVAVVEAHLHEPCAGSRLVAVIVVPAGIGIKLAAQVGRPVGRDSSIRH